MQQQVEEPTEMEASGEGEDRFYSTNSEDEFFYSTRSFSPEPQPQSQQPQHKGKNDPPSGSQMRRQKERIEPPSGSQMRPQKDIPEPLPDRDIQPPQDPTCPPPSRFLLTQQQQYRRASEMKLNPSPSKAKVSFDEEEQKTIDEPRKTLTRTGESDVFSSADAVDGGDKGNDNDIPMTVGIGGGFTSTADATDEYSYFTPLPPRENVVDLETMKESVWYTFPDWRRRLSGFSLLIVLASIIATCGVLNDSTATVIGAMIVAPLMTPILGTMLGIVLTDLANMIVSSTLVLLGMACAIAIGFLFSLFVDESTIDPANNSQVASRIQPKLLDLIAALATGAVGAVALVRTDIAGSLPGVSIAISLVPPLNVVGVCLRLQNWDAAAGALLLFLTNYLCIVSVGIVVMMMYRVHRMARRRRYAIQRFGLWLTQKFSFIVFIVSMVGVGFLLYYTSALLRTGIEIEKCLEDTAVYPFLGRPSNTPADGSGEWTVVDATAIRKAPLQNLWRANVVFAGTPPFPIVGNMTIVAEECNVDDISLQFIPTYSYVGLLTDPKTQSPTSQPSFSISPSGSANPSEMPSQAPSPAPTSE